MIIAEETDTEAKAKWEHYKAGADLEALAYRATQAGDDPSSDKYNMANRRRLGIGTQESPINQGILVGSYVSVARMLDELASVLGVEGAMLTFDEFVSGMEKFGTRIQPLMRSRRARATAA